MSNIKKRLTLAERIKKARQERGLSQKDLGEALELSDKAVSSYEVGRAEPPISKLREISRATFKPLAYFLDELDPDDLDLQLKMSRIERELLEVKKLLSKRK